MHCTVRVAGAKAIARHLMTNIYARASLSTIRLTHSPSRAVSMLNFTHALTRAVPHSFANDALRLDWSKNIVYERAVKQWRKYTEILTKCGLEVVTIPADERYPDCVFIEDSALVIGQRACLTRPGHPNRRGEVQAVKDELKRLKIETVELDDPSALLDGGDIIFTGQEILVGDSTRTNEEGAMSLQRAFPEFPVTRIPIKGCLHLKSVASLGNEGVIIVGGSQAGSAVLQNLKQRAQGQYKFVQLDDDCAANVLFVNGNAIIKSQKEIGPSNFRKLTEALTVPCLEVEFDEFYKADGCLSCCSVLLQTPGK
ncbi:hypothetical protein BaRGS_00015563 [Batillaria attramentaria]|uniref:Dimethylargininase n=1 Tax=Batillaria attramentaria TaxID=370345 RepID=A0ABD0L173_9CAEN